MSDLESVEFTPIHKIFKVTISSIKHKKDTNSEAISFIKSISSTLPLGLSRYCETNATYHPIEERAVRVKEILKLLDICQSTILNEESSMNNITNYCERNTDFSTQTLYFKPIFHFSKYTNEE